MNRRHLAFVTATAVLGLAPSAHAERSEPHARRKHGEPAEQVLPASAPTSSTVAPSTRVSIPLRELGSTSDGLKLSNRASESFTFSARADQVLVAADLDLVLALPDHVDDLLSLDVLFNGERVERFDRAQLSRGGRHRITLDASLLASDNVLTLRLRRQGDEEGCGLVAPGSWRALNYARLLLGSADLPMPENLAVLPLPFFDAAFDRDQTLHFVLPAHATAEQLAAINDVAAWFALRGKGRLSFAAHLDELPNEHAVVFIPDRATAEALQLPAPSADVARAGLELRAHPRSPNRRLLVLWGYGPSGLASAAQRLLQRGTSLEGGTVAATSDGALAELEPYQVPRWVTRGDVVLGKLPQQPPLRIEGGHSESLRIPFRLPPDSFAWPKDYVELDLGYAQKFSESAGPAHLHVALNGVSIGTLPSVIKGRSTLRIERSLLRGFNELLLQASYASSAGQGCHVDHDANTWVEVSPDSRLEVGHNARFAMLPDLRFFLYDGFPFSVHGDLRESLLVLPTQPDVHELSSMLDAVAHFATITGHPPTKLRVALGEPEPKLLATRDILLIAAQERHPWLERFATRWPLSQRGARSDVHYPSPSQLLERVLSGSFGTSELARAQKAVGEGAFSAVFAVPSPWSPTRSLVAITATSADRMPRFSALVGYAEAEESRNDLLIKTERGRALFQLSAAHGRGALPWWLELRWWLSYYWLVLLPMLGLGSLLWALHARDALSKIAEERLREADG